jgi:transposase-like protein
LVLDTLSCVGAVAVLFGGSFVVFRLRKESVMLVELRVAEQRYRAVREVLDGASVTGVARRFGVSRQSVHAWLRRYAAEGGLGGLGDRSSRPHSCSH